MYKKLVNFNILIGWKDSYKIQNSINSILALCLIFLSQITSPCIAQPAINFGNLLYDEILCDNIDTFTFQANAGDAVVIHVVELSDFGGVCYCACCCFDQEIKLLDSSDNILAINASATSSNICVHRFRTKIGPETLSSSDTYKVTISDKIIGMCGSGQGEYAIFLQRINAPESANSISPGQNFLVNLNRGEVDTYELEACTDSNTSIVIDMTPGVIGDIDPVLELYNQQGQALALPDNGHIIFNGNGIFTLLAFSRIDEEGTYHLNFECMITTSVIEKEIESPFNLNGNYPNPFSSETRISFDLSKATNISLVIYDILGQKVKTLVDHHLGPGKHVVTFNAAEVNVGIYQYALMGDGFTQVKKMVLMK